MAILPWTISGLAAVRSKRPGYRPPFGPGNTAPATRVRDSFADAELVRAAVVALKSRGFQVSGVNRIGVHLSGPPQLFMKTFAVTLELDATTKTIQVPGSGIKGYIDTNNTPDLKEILAGIFFSGPDTAFGDESPPARDKPWQIYLSELPAQLARSIQYKTRPEVLVWVVDTGFSVNHPWFDAMGNADVTWRTVHEYKHEVPVQDEEAMLAEMEWEQDNAPNMSDEERQRRREESELRTEISKSAADPYRDPGNHGTAVLANLLAMAPKANVSIARVLERFPVWNCVFDLVTKTQSTPRIILSLSLGPARGTDDDAENSRWKDIVALADEFGILVVAASGNDQKALPRWTLADKAFIVAACARTVDGNVVTTTTIATDGRDGNRSIPDICALGGTVEPGVGYVYCPKGLPADEKWSARTGSSYATPQVAAICAMVWSTCPQASATEVKEIVMIAARPITSDTTLNGTRLQDIHVAAGGRTISPGLANANRAVLLAHLLAIARLIEPKVLLSQVLKDPRWQGTLSSMGLWQ